MASFIRIGLVLTLCIGLVFGSPCSKQNRTSDPAACLAEVKVEMYRTDKFWFGEDYAINCPNGPADGSQCSNPNPSQADSLASRMLPGSYNVDMLTKFVEVEFTSEPGQYTGCGNTFTETETTVIDIDPTSSEIVRPWFVRNTPEMTWDSTPGDYYAVYVYAPGFFITHAIYINIQGNDIPTSGENVINLYNGPLNPGNLDSPYVFMLFKQDGYVNPEIAKQWYEDTNPEFAFRFTSHIPEFITRLNMTGPIGINWLVATSDEYAASINDAFILTCPIFIGQALDQLPRPFLPNPASLTVQMDVTFEVTELNYNVCCTSYKERARSLTLNPIGNELLQSSATRTGLVQNVEFEKRGFTMASKNFTGDMYTMIAMDPDIPLQFAAVGNESHPLLHQMKINIVDGDFMTGDDVITWNGPAPPNDEPHYYYFLLYKHAQPVTRELMTSYAAKCGERLAGRCLYDINRAVAENGFQLVGVNWFRAVRDPYVRYRNVQSNPDNTNAQCMGQPGYRRYCKTSGMRPISACSKQNRADGIAECLNDIKEAMYRTDNLWFGEDYAEACPNGNADGFLCTNPSPDKQHSLATRILPSSYDEDMLTKFVEVKFTSDADQYIGCGNTFTENQPAIFDIDPTSSQIVRPWFVRQLPEVTWDFTPGDYYTLYVYDAGYYITHAIYINIQGNTILPSGENVIKEYGGPLNPTTRDNPYAFLLFKQNGYVDPVTAAAWYNTTTSGFAVSSHIPEFITRLGMTGPIGINWMLASGDEYAASVMESRGFVATCPLFIGQALDQLPRPFLPSPASLTVQMDVNFLVTELFYSVCCSSYKERSRELTLNPMGNELLMTSSTRTGLVQTVEFEKLGYISTSKNFTGDMYTLIAMDPDIPLQYAAVGNESHPLLHQMKINIMDGDFMTGDDVITWNGPNPPNDEPHYYYFLLYKHAQPVTRELMTSYAAECGERLAGRCLYDINRAVHDNHFTLVGASWFRAVNDLYVRYRQHRTEKIERHATRFVINRHRNKGIMGDPLRHDSWGSRGEILAELSIVKEIVQQLTNVQ